MLKIKFNINKFTVIFLRRFEGKNERKRISFNLYQLQRLPSFLFSLCSVQCLPFLLFFLFQPFFFFFFSGSVFSAPFLGKFSASLLFLFFLPFFSFQFTCCPFFSPKTFFFQPKTILCSAQKQFSLQPKTFFSLAQNIFFNPKTILSLAQNVFQPKILFQPKNLSLFMVQRLFFFF